MKVTRCKNKGEWKRIWDSCNNSILIRKPYQSHIEWLSMHHLLRSRKSWRVNILEGAAAALKMEFGGFRGLKGTRKCELFACRSGLFILPDSPERSRLIKLGKYYTAFVLFTRVLSICEFVSNTKDGFTRARMHRTKSNIVCWRLAEKEICRFFFPLSTRAIMFRNVSSLNFGSRIELGRARERFKQIISPENFR